MSDKKPKDEQIAFCFVKIKKKVTRYHADVDIHLDEDDIMMKRALITSLTDTAHKLLESLKKTEEKEEKK